MWSQLVEAKLHVLLLHIFLWMSSVGLMIPHLTVLAANDFASSEGHRVDCGTSLGAAPPECRHANAVTVTWVAWSSFFQNAVLGVWFLPLIGLLSDQQGRLRFMIAGQVLVALPLMWVFFHVSDPAEVPFKGYFVLDALKGAINPMSLCLSYAADRIPPENRATMFGWQLGTMSLAVIVSALTGAFLGPGGATTLALMLVFSNIMLIFFLLPESVTEECKRLAEQHSHKASVMKGWEGIREGFAIVTRNTLFMRLALLMAVTGMVFECLKDVLFNYLMVKLSFSSHHFAKIMAVMGLGSLAVQLGLLPTMLRLVGEKWVLVTALACSTVEMSMLAAASNEAMVYVSISVGTLGSMAFPGISALKSNLSHPSEQGVVQGALFAARGIAQGIGPLAFSALFNYFVEPEHYMPGAPLIGAAIIMGFGFLIALTLDIPDGEPRSSDSGAAVPLETNMSLYGAPSLSESADMERLLGGGERDSEMAHLTGSEGGTRSPLKSYVLTLQTRSSFHSNR